ncbi:hypothetical protein BYT27DRAFT_7221213 [Phlegmacium glaucopus]|nr:hypothetical protein BYT27DRAFT_7221213 [Phlegmacium glaucopus]
MGRYLEAADDDEPCKWIKTDTGPVTTLLFVCSSGGPTNISRADQDGLLGYLRIDLELPYLGPPGLHSMYPKYKEIARVADHKLMEGLRNNTQWRSYLEENGLHVWQPTLMDFIHIFVAKSQFYDNWRPAFREARQFPILIDWLNQTPGCLTNKEMWGNDKDTYSLSDMNKWMARGGPPEGKKVDGKEKRQEKSGDKKSKKKKREVSPASDIGGKKSKKGKKKDLDSFPNIPFRMFSKIILSNFGSDISLATVLVLLFTLAENADLLNLHFRQQHSEYSIEHKQHISGWIIALTKTLISHLGKKKKKTLFHDDDRTVDISEAEETKLVAKKLDKMAVALHLSPYNRDDEYTGKLLPVSLDEIQPVHVICPASFVCNTGTCIPRSLVQNTRERDIPEVTLIKGHKIFKKVPVLTGKCPECATSYHADHERFFEESNVASRWKRVYINSAKYFKIGSNLWVDRLFSKSAINATYSFHASVSAYSEYWNNTFGTNSTNSFVQESLRTIAGYSKLDLELDDALNIKEVTTEAYSILGENGIIRAADHHACGECTQEYRKSSTAVFDNPAAVVGVDENCTVPPLAENVEQPRSLMSDDSSTNEMDVDHEKLWTTMRVLDGVVMGPNYCAFDQQQRHDDPSEEPPPSPNYFSPARYYCVETICAPCGVVVAWTKFARSESTTNVLNFLESVYPTEESRPDYICIDKGCQVLRTAVTNKSWEKWEKTTRFIVDTYHYINHRVTDYLCRKYCNPSPGDGSAPNLVIIAYGNDGQPYAKRAFNTQVCEQLNAWLGGFESILKRMTPGNFNWFLHVMLFYHTQYVINRQKRKAGSQEDDKQCTVV